MRAKLIAESLRKAPNLEIVSSPPGYRLPNDLAIISENPCLKSIWIKCFHDKLDPEFERALMLEANVKVQALIRFDEIP
jgi:hypothetical protein